MDFSQIIPDLKQLIGLDLQAINPKTGTIKLISVNLDQKKYVVQSVDSSKYISRNISELEEIFNELHKNYYCNVDQVLSCSGRHQPETIFANLPYIQFFRFNNRKHLFFKNDNVHDYGVIQELSTKELKNIKNVISSHKNLNINLVVQQMNSVTLKIQDELKKLNIKTPGILVDSEILDAIDELNKIKQNLSNASINNKTLKVNSQSSDVENVYLKVRENNYDLADIVDSPFVTGIDEGENNEIQYDSNKKNELKIPNIRRQTPSLTLLYERLHYNEIEIQPEYQRQDRIWPADRKSKLIESILMGLPLPIFYFGERSNDNWVIIDGLQRLTTIQDFMRNDFSLSLDKDSSVFELNGKKFSDFDRKYTRALREFEITAYVIDIDDKDENNGDRFIIELFHRINTYGVKLSEQEIRSAINFGPCVYFLKNLANSKEFLDATNNSVNPKRQKDVELVLSAISFIIYGYKNFNYSTYNAFLSKAMKWINNQNYIKNNVDKKDGYIPNSYELKELIHKFNFGLNLSLEVFGSSAFKKTNNMSKREPISKPLFEVLVCIFANATEEQKKLILLNKSKLIECLFSAISTDSNNFSKWESEAYESAERGLHYSISTSTGKRVTVLYRFKSILNIIKETTDCDITIEPLVSYTDQKNVN